MQKVTDITVEVTRAQQAQASASRPLQTITNQVISPFPTCAYQHKASKYGVCGQCKVPFNTSDNDENACSYHDGELEPGAGSREPGQDIFVDWDDHVQGDSTRKQCMPKGYLKDDTKSCCDVEGDDEGRTTGPHVEKGEKRRR